MLLATSPPPLPPPLFVCLQILEQTRGPYSLEVAQCCHALARLVREPLRTIASEGRPVNPLPQPGSDDEVEGVAGALGTGPDGEMKLLGAVPGDGAAAAATGDGLAQPIALAGGSLSPQDSRMPGFVLML